jgi:hypothetical protein
LKIDNFKVVPAKHVAPQMKTVVTAGSSAPSLHPSIKEGFGSSSVRKAVGGEERRRSQRVLLRVKVNLHVALSGKTTTFDVSTLSVNDHGALVVMPRSLPLDTRVVLEHSVTRHKVTCKIPRPAREMPEGFHIPLEFDTPEPNFWGISFPPADWRPPDDL